MKKTLRITRIVICSIAALLLLVVLFGSVFGGCAAKRYVNHSLPELLGRKVTVDHVGVNLFTGRVAVRDMAVYEEDGSTLFACFDTLDVAVSLLRLVGQQVWVRHFDLVGLKANVWQDSSQFNFSSIIDRLGKDEDTNAVKDTTPSPWSVSLHRIRIADGSIHYADLQKGSHLGFNHLNLHVPDFAFGGRERTDADLSVALAEGGLLTANGNYDSESREFDISLALEQLALNQALPYMANRAYIEEIRGHVNLYATAHGNMNHILDMVISAQSNIMDADIIDREQQSVASIRRSDVEIGRMVISQQLYDINSITIEGLTASYELFADSTNTITRLLMPQIVDSTEALIDTVADLDTLSSNLPPKKIHVGHFLLSGSSFTYADHTLPTDFQFPVTDIRIESHDLSTSGSNNARISATLPNGGSANVEWNGNITDWKQHQSLQLNILGLHLTDFNPYMTAYFGMPFSEGIFSLTSTNTITGSQLDGKNKIDIYKPTLGAKQKGVKPRLKLPIKAALYVLKDKDGKVLLEVPVSGNIDNPEFKYMKMVWKTLGNLIVKVATSPMRLFGSSDDEDDGLFIAIDPKEKDFTSEQFYQIDKVANIAKSDETVMLEFKLATRPTDNEDTDWEHFNKLLRRHLEHLGISKQQFTIKTAKPDAEVKEEGYVVEVRIKN